MLIGRLQKANCSSTQLFNHISNVAGHRSIGEHAIVNYYTISLGPGGEIVLAFKFNLQIYRCRFYKVGMCGTLENEQSVVLVVNLIQQRFGMSFASETSLEIQVCQIGFAIAVLVKVQTPILERIRFRVQVNSHVGDLIMTQVGGIFSKRVSYICLQ